MDFSSGFDILSTIDLSFWGTWIAGQVGYVVGYILNLAIISLLLWKFFLQKYVIYRYEVEVTVKRGENEVIKFDRGRIIKLKDGSEGFKLLKNKVILDPLDFKYVKDIKKPFSFGLVRIFQFSPRSFAYLQEKNKFKLKDWMTGEHTPYPKLAEQFSYAESNIDQDKSFKQLTVLEQDKNRAIDMALKTEKKLNPPNAFTQYILPLVGMGFIVTVLVLLFLMADKGIQLGNTFTTAAELLQKAIDMFNKCQVTSMVAGG